MVSTTSTTSATGPPPGPRAATAGQALEHQRLTTKTRRVEGVIAALQTRKRERAQSGVVPPALEQALEDFTRQLAALKVRSETLLAGRDPVPPPRVA